MSDHVPVMRDEIVEALQPHAGAIYVDATFGGGGYSAALLACGASVYAIDRDPDAIARGQSMAQQFEGRLVLIEGRFAEMQTLIGDRGVTSVDGIAFDLGVSSFQLDEPERGFSFRDDGPLDMRMSARGASAADVVNTTEESDLADILWRYGEEKRSRHIARAIVAARPFARTRALVETIERAAGPGARRFAIHPATRSFQALRIYVNDELGELERGLVAAERCLKPRGRLAVVSFHSLEDRIVKRFLSERAGRAGGASRHAPERRRAQAPTFRLLGAARTPSAREIAANPRARSARLRGAERNEAPAWILTSVEGGQT